ncbi:Trk system potassium transporter TrkA [Phaeodactylibacter luteus]|uniref:Trk system potassium uptake protein TrkA n=1 Tax=Phaeodactylibacter luteus TaxID=1564516 RepID=A0A5C6RK73_9BACT|nr:Trk system potassium transporter TrkA [Phaeodactylibacter luteus]TXB61752.1 Trk system potassium transporter TrkA [Phaeodactylibacter luteus]
MKIVIAGAGDIGFHLAELLAFENQDIVLVDTNQEVLDYAATHLDVMTLKGDSSSIDVLEQADIGRARLVLAVTTSEKTNLVTAILAKKMGARQTIARVTNQEYLAESQRELFRELGVDSLISPVLLAAEEIQRLIRESSFTDHFAFEKGKINLIGVTLDEYSPLANQQLFDISEQDTEVDLRPIAILRGHRTIIPRGKTILRRGDHVYFISKRDNMERLTNLVGKQKHNVRNIMILGGSPLGMATAKRLEDEYNVTVIEKDRERCKVMAERLNNTLVINGDTSNIDLLEEEGLSRMDAFIALTGNSETNIIASLTAKNRGVLKTIAQVENKEYIHISQNIGVDTLINKKLIAANNIFRFIRKGKVEAITSLHGVDAEVIEYLVHKENQLTRKPLKELHFPKTALIGGVIRGEEALIPDGEFQLQLNDKVIVFALPEAIERLEKLFH